MSLLIRPVREEDAASIAELLNPLIEPGTYTAMDEPVSVEGQVTFIRRFPAGGVFHAAVRDAGIVARGSRVWRRRVIVSKGRGGTL